LSRCDWRAEEQQNADGAHDSPLAAGWRTSLNEGQKNGEKTRYSQWL
jgi:hypothetical protein